jgi:hypothetical protein
MGHGQIETAKNIVATCPPEISMTEGTGLARQIVRCCATCPAGTVRTKTYDVDVPFMQLQRHGWDIHAV